MKRRLGIVLVISVIMMAFVFLYFGSNNNPPKENQLIASFYTHRTAYEHLRDMLQADNQLLRVADWGVETTKSLRTSKPPEGDFPVARYNEYLAQLRETGGTVAVRDAGTGSAVLVCSFGRQALEVKLGILRSVG